MSSRLLDRIATLLRADAHGVVDALSERAPLVRQHLRDAELELLQKRARVAALEEERKRLEAELARRAEEVARLDDDVALALAQEQQDLARFAVRRLLPRREEVRALEARLTTTREAAAALAATLCGQEQAFGELRERARAVLACDALRAADDDPLGPLPVDEQAVDLELLRRRSGGAAR